MTSAQADGRPRVRSRRPPPAQAWSGLGPIRSLRGGLLLVTTLAVTPLVLFASGMALMRAHDTDRLPTAAAWVTVAALPLLIGVAAVLVVGLAWEGMVMQWLGYLERVSRAYARGRYSVRPRRLQAAPSEFLALGQAVEEMAAAVEHRDHALREALDEQTLLLRELHHRVKNNLQIIGSLLSLQAGRAGDPAAREALHDALMRIDAMSLGQKFIQRQEDGETVSSVELFEAFVAQTRARLGYARGLEVAADVQQGALPVETGSRLVLVATEALISAFHAAEGPLTLQLGVKFEAQAVVLTLSAPHLPDAFAPAADRVSWNLMSGYVRQLRGYLDAPEGSGALVVVAPMESVAGAAANDAEATDRPQGLRFFRVLDRTRRGLAS